MATSTNGPTQQDQQPTLQVLGQYIKDLSFENPNAPRSLAPTSQQPEINININVEANPLAEPDIEVMLKIEGKAQLQGSILFNFELAYGGVFRIQNVPQENLRPMVLIECPRLLFPFARDIIAKAVRDGGFPPLLLQPVDFVSLYQQKLSELTPTPPATPQA